MAENKTASGPFSRRGFLGVAAGGVAGLLMPVAGSALSASAATASPTPKLPGEYYRLGSRKTPAGTLYDDICVRINGDPARLFVPQTVKPAGSPAGVVWFYHGAGTDHNALAAGFKTHAEIFVDSGAIAICQKAGGTLYSHPTAVALQVAGGEYMGSVFTVASNTLRSTSAGGALACETYARKLIPGIIGMYPVNAVYDLEAMYREGGNSTTSIAQVFNNDPAAIAAANPARHGSAAWSGARVRVVVSQPNSSDTSVPPARHGLKLLALAAPTAAEASLKWHTAGHNTPGFARTDFMEAARRWTRLPADTTPPTVRVTSPTEAQKLTGVITLTALAADNLSIARVAFTVGSVTVPAQLHLENAVITAEPAATRWVAKLDTARLPDGPVSVTATAKDSTGNTTISSPVRATVYNAPTLDTKAPTVSVVSPVDGATVKGTVTIAVMANDNVAVTSVALYAGTRLIGRATDQGSGRWTLPFNTNTQMSPNGTYSVTARATDAAGNTTTSAPVRMLISN